MRWRGFAAVTAAASLWGAAGVVARSLFAQGFAPGDLAGAGGPPAAVASGMASALGFAAWVLLGRDRARA